MQNELKNAASRVVGTKQVLRAINEGKANMVFLGKDADGFIYHRVQRECENNHVPVTLVETMAELGKLCMVQVPTACAAVLK